jgi:ribonuclease VapC
VSCIFDSSALLAVVFDEPGDEEVFGHLGESGGRVSAVNWSETGTKMFERGMKAREIRRELAYFAIEVVPLDARQALRAAELRLTTRPLGLSLGDRCCLALSEQTPGAVIVTADKAWKKLRDFDIRLIR